MRERWNALSGRQSATVIVVILLVIGGCWNALTGDDAAEPDAPLLIDVATEEGVELVLETDVPPTNEPTEVPPTEAPTNVPTEVPPTDVPATDAPTTAPTAVPPTAIPPTEVPAPPPTEVPAPAAPISDCVDINRASFDELKRIIHIDDERAQELIRLRPFSSIDSLTRINGIGPARLRDIKAQGLACVLP